MILYTFRGVSHDNLPFNKRHIGLVLCISVVDGLLGINAEGSDTALPELLASILIIGCDS